MKFAWICCIKQIPNCYPQKVIATISNDLSPLVYACWNVSSCMHCRRSTPNQNSFRSVMVPSVVAVILMIFRETLSVNPRALTSAVNFVLKGMSRIGNFDNWQWVWKYLIIHIRLFKNILCCNTLLKITLSFSISLPIRSKYSSDDKSCTCCNICHTERWSMQIGLFGKWLLLSKLTLYLPQDEICSCTFLADCGSICHQRFSKKSIFR